MKCEPAKVDTSIQMAGEKTKTGSNESLIFLVLRVGTLMFWSKKLLVAIKKLYEQTNYPAIM